MLHLQYDWTGNLKYFIEALNRFIGLIQSFT